MSGRLDLRLALPALGAWAGAFIGVGGAAPRGALVAAAAAAVAVAGSRSRRWALVAAAALCSATTSLGSLSVLAQRVGPLPRLAGARAAVTAELVVSGDPRTARPRSSAPWALSQPVVVVACRVERLHAEGRDYVLHQPLVVLATAAGWASLLPGTRLRAEGRLARGKDGAALLAPRGLPVVLDAAPLVQRVAGRVRSGLRAVVRGRGRDVEGLLPGIVLGDTSRLDADLKLAARSTGLTHITAVSGFNVAVVLAAVLLVVRRTRAGPRLQALAGMAAVAGFVVLARPSPSVLRAAVMAAVAMLALALGRPRAALPALSGTVVVLLLVDPALARSYGFVLSALATVALLTLAPWLSRRLVERHRWPGWAADAVAVPTAAHLVTAPVVAMLSGQVSLVAIPANLLADPAVAPATLLGLLAALLAPLAHGPAALLAWLAAWPTRWVAAVARGGAALPWATVPVPSGRAALWVVLGAGAGLAAALRRRRGRRAAVVALAAFVVSRAAVAVVAPTWPPPGWQLVVCDVGQGDAEVLATQPGHAVVVDTGPDPAPVQRCLDRLGVLAVDLLVLTHIRTLEQRQPRAPRRGCGHRDAPVSATTR